MYRLNLHFNKMFQGSVRTVKDLFLILRETYKGMLAVSFSSDMEALFHQENVILIHLGASHFRRVSTLSVHSVGEIL